MRRATDDPGGGGSKPLTSGVRGTLLVAALACVAWPAHAASPAASADDRADMFTGLWGWMRTLCLWLLDLLQWLADLTGNWGVAIILVALLVRVSTYPLARRALREQKRFNDAQSKLKPALAEIKRNYKGGEQSERIIELYEAHGISPAAGVKPLFIVLLQLPVFVALFQILQQAPALRGADFLWIADLAQPDRLASLGTRIPWFGSAFNLLPVLLAATILLSTATAPGTLDPAAARRRLWISGAMAIVFFALFYSFPAGLVLYWVTANLLQVAQQSLVAFAEK
jgi:YidC/Oxa1 family membrane protein insertase